MIIVVTGTGTDVGKTVTTAALAAALHRAGIDVIPVKPIQTGEPAGSGDIATITALTGITGLEGERFPDPLSPDLAAQQCGRPCPRLEDIAAWIRGIDRPDAVVLVEGAGGVLVRLGENWDITDLARALSAPVVVVTSVGLGSLNAAALTCEALARRGLNVMGLIGSQLPEQPDLATRLNLDALPKQTGVPLLGVLPAGLGAVDKQSFSDVATSALQRLLQSIASMRSHV